MGIKLVDMRKTAEEKAEECMPMAMGAVNEYPGGLCISLTESELERLNVDHKDWEVGDIFDLRAMGRVCCVSENETDMGTRTRIEIQLVMLGCEVEDSEDEENTED